MVLHMGLIELHSMDSVSDNPDEHPSSAMFYAWKETRKASLAFQEKRYTDAVTHYRQAASLWYSAEEGNEYVRNTRMSLVARDFAEAKKWREKTGGWGKLAEGYRDGSNDNTGE